MSPFNVNNRQSQDFRGYIFNYDPALDFYINDLNTGPNGVNPTSSPPPSYPNNYDFTVGAPFYFYFGLIKGETAIDKFASKYIRREEL
jgi:hypothetical protein